MTFVTVDPSRRILFFQAGTRSAPNQDFPTVDDTPSEPAGLLCGRRCGESCWRSPEERADKAGISRQVEHAVKSVIACLYLEHPSTWARDARACQLSSWDRQQLFIRSDDTK